MTPRGPVVAICGPTASGKSALGINLARALDGEVLSVDSVQVYRGADIGSAKVTQEQRRLVAHHLIDIFAPSESCNAGEFCDKALTALDDVVSRGKLPVLTVGTTMYFTALVHGLVAIPQGDEKLRSELKDVSSQELYERLRAIDVNRAEELHPNDRVRILRAIESHHLAGKGQSVLHEEHSFRHVAVTGLFIVLVHSREELYERINRRTSEMVRAGLLDETAMLLEKYDDSCAVFTTIGYREAKQVLKGDLEESALTEAISLSTRRYAKRQMTFWRNEPRKRGWSVVPDEGDGSAIEVGKEGIVGRRSQGLAKGFLVLRVTEEELVERVQDWLQEENRRTHVVRPVVWYVQVQ